MNGIPPTVMRQVHCPFYRNYVADRLIGNRHKKGDNICQMPNCEKNEEAQGFIQCVVCSRWFHKGCVTPKAKLEEEFECVFCDAMYK